ncbi:ribose 5-phosphate isomerase B [Candidatus Aerophobetes bacterium]|nr:ribose 5-phosphate isomerase B [Candidatus Aerophobetes bacterium]
MKIVLASDHAGFKLKEEIKKFLGERGIEFEDCGSYNEERTDYVDWGEKAINKIINGESQRGILICGTGLGMEIVANKFYGIRATPCYDLYTAKMARQHNDSNVLTLGGRITDKDLAKKIVEVWLETEFQGNRHKVRLDKIRKIEEKNFK